MYLIGLKAFFEGIKDDYERKDWIGLSVSIILMPVIPILYLVIIPIDLIGNFRKHGSNPP